MAPRILIRHNLSDTCTVQAFVQFSRVFEDAAAAMVRQEIL